MVEIIKKKEKVLAMIIRNNHDCEGADFLTPDSYSQQVAFMHHPEGKEIDAHVHNILQRSIVMTQEVLLIKEGILRVDFYDDYEEYLESKLLFAGDVILLVSGGHGFKVIEEVKMIEVKQGPYSAESDKKRFPSISDDLIIVKE